GLLFQCFTRFAYQAGVFHRDHRLSGEILQQRDLLLGKGPDFLAVDGDETLYCIIFEQRHDQHGPCTPEVHYSPQIGIAVPVTFRVSAIDHLDDPLAFEQAPYWGNPPVNLGILLSELGKRRRNSADGGCMKALTVIRCEMSERGLA